MEHVGDPLVEIEAMRAVANAVQDLDDSARGRVLRWACDRFSVAGVGKKVATIHPKDDSNDGRDGREFETAADLLAATEPQTEAENVLAIGYWFQVALGQSDVEAQAVNTELKHQGHGVSNITRAFSSLMKQRPQPVIQVRKTGSSRQARKKYKLTTAGIDRVRRMIAGEHENGTNGNGD